MADDQSKPLPRELRRFASVLVYAADFMHHADITLQGIPHRNYLLRLFIENEELGLQTQDNRTWTPARRQFVPCFPTTYTYRWLFVCRGVFPTSRMRAEIQMKSGHLFWAKDRLASEVIDLQALFNDCWNTSKDVFTVPSQS